MINILMSTYNGEKYLSEQIDSIINQTEKNWHLYIRDDGSTDQTINIIDRYTQKDQRITFVKNDGKNLGAMMSFFYLLETFGDSEYIAFSDQDDVWYPNKLELCLQTIQQAEKNDDSKTPIVVHCDLEVVDSELKTITNSFWKYTNINVDLLDNNIHYMALCNSITGCAMMFNHAAQHFAFPLGNPRMHDSWIGLKTLANKGRVIALPQQLIKYRQHNSNVCGAQKYSFKLGNIKEKISDYKQLYKMSHPFVFKNWWHFIIWKIRYFVEIHK